LLLEQNVENSINGKKYMISVEDTANI